MLVVEQALLERLLELGQLLAVLLGRRGGEHGPGLGERELALGLRHLDRLPSRRRHSCEPSPRIACSSCSKPPVSIAQCMPHSFGASVSHHQRPARTG